MQGRIVKSTGGANANFRRCVLAGVSMNRSAVGFPDGNPEPSVTLDLKNTFVLTPSAAKTITFAIAPNSSGALVMLEGNLASSVTGFLNWTPTTGSGWTTATIAPATPFAGCVPDVRIGSISSGWGNLAPGTFTSFRPIVAVAEMSFTGSTMYDGGTVTVSSVSGTMPSVGSYSMTYATTSSMSIPILNSRLVEGATALRMNNTEAFAARTPFTSRVLTGAHGYLPIVPMAYDDNSDLSTRYGYCVATGGATGPIAGPVYAQSPFKIVSYSGLDSSASVTVTMRYCVQLAVSQGSTFAIVANPSSAPSPSDMTWFETLTANLPTVEQVSRVVGRAARVAALFGGANTGNMALRDDL